MARLCPRRQRPVVAVHVLDQVDRDHVLVARIGQAGGVGEEAAPAVGQHDDHPARRGVAREPGPRRKRGVGLSAAVQQVEHRIPLAGLVVAVRQQHRERVFGVAERRARDPHRARHRSRRLGRRSGLAARRSRGAHQQHARYGSTRQSPHAAHCTIGGGDLPAASLLGRSLRRSLCRRARCGGLLEAVRSAAVGGGQSRPAAARRAHRPRHRSGRAQDAADARTHPSRTVALLRRPAVGRRHGVVRHLSRAGTRVLAGHARGHRYPRAEGPPQGADLHQPGGHALSALLLGWPSGFARRAGARTRRQPDRDGQHARSAW